MFLGISFLFGDVIVEEGCCIRLVLMFNLCLGEFRLVYFFFKVFFEVDILRDNIK